MKRHDMEQRALKPGEEPENIVLEFSPRDRQDMLMPYLWERSQQGDEVLSSFALIANDPSTTAYRIAAA